MTFEECKNITTIIHYALVLLVFFSIVLFGVWRKKYTIETFIIRFYIVFFIWIGIVFVLDGCPITLIENKLAVKFWGRPFYPEYGFGQTDAFMWLTYPKIYLPLVILLVIKGVTYLSKKIHK